LSHGGEVSGFTAENLLFPENAWRSSPFQTRTQPAPRRNRHGIAPLLLASDDPATPQKLAQAKKIFDGLQHGTIDRSLFTDNANAYFSAQALKDFAYRPSAFGTAARLCPGKSGTGAEGMISRSYRNQILRNGKTLTRLDLEPQASGAGGGTPDGKLEQYQIAENSYPTFFVGSVVPLV